MKTFELQPIDGRKSFYNKAKVTELDNGDIELTSYTTIVAEYITENLNAYGMDTQLLQCDISTLFCMCTVFRAVEKLGGKI